jgi:hypothetical protein
MHMEATARTNESEARPLVGLFSDLWRYTTELIREEGMLATAEMSRKASQVGSGVGWAGAGAAITLSGLILLLAAAAVFIARFLPPDVAGWLAPLLVGGFVFIVGLLVLAKARSDLKAENLAPRRTAHSLRQDVELAKEHLR